MTLLLGSPIAGLSAAVGNEASAESVAGVQKVAEPANQNVH